MYNVLIILLVVLAATGCGRNLVGPAMETLAESETKYEIPDFPGIKENKDGQCFVFSVEAILRYYGEKVTAPRNYQIGIEETLYRAWLFLLGYEMCEVRHDVNNIKAYIREDIPVLIFLKCDKTSHCVVGYKFWKNYIGVRDPDQYDKDVYIVRSANIYEAHILKRR